MDGTKLATETLICESIGRGVFCEGRNLCVSIGGPCRNKNLADSNSASGGGSQTPKGPGFLSKDQQEMGFKKLSILKEI